MTIDAHVHLWERGSLQTEWMEKPPYRGDPKWRPLRASFRPDDLQVLMDANGIDGAVLVEAVDNLEETDALLSIAREHNWAAGVVGWLPLADAPALEAALERVGNVASLVGIRHLINTEPDPDWVLQDTVVASLNRIAQAGLSFDYVGISMDHLERLPRLADACPELTIVLDHLNNPPIAEESFQPWADLLGEAAERINVTAKVSGLEMCCRWDHWTADDWRPYVDHALACFGPDRLMLGSNWPVSTLSGRYEQIWAAHRAWLLGLSETERTAIASATACRVYARNREQSFRV
ncbi:MAG: amidohydrolase family protein [Methyloceanibacter sp.]|nr:amidohydrolase family protein [Methyloceanibacter sp.]